MTLTLNDGEEGNTVDDDWFDGEESLDLEVKVEYVEEMVVKGEEEWGSDDDLDPYDEGDEAIVQQGASAEPLPSRARNQNPNSCRTSGHATTTHGQSRSLPCVPCLPTPQPTRLPPPPASSPSS